MKSAALVVVHYGDVGLVVNLLQSLTRHPDRELLTEIIIVNNGRRFDTETESFLASPPVPHVRIVDNPGGSYAEGVNVGMRETSADLVLLSNNDVEWMEQSSVSPMLNALCDAGVGVVGPQLVFPNGHWQRSFGRFPSLAEALRSVVFIDSAANFYRARSYPARIPKGPIEVEYVDGAFFGVRRKCFEELGGFDEAFRFYAEETDFCYRARAAGWRRCHVPATTMLHIRGASSSRQAVADYRARLISAQVQFLEKHGRTLQRQLYPHLMALAEAGRWVLYSTVSLIARDNLAWRERARRVGARFSSDAS